MLLPFRLASLALLLVAPVSAQPRVVHIQPGDLRVVERHSGPVNYYRVVEDPGGAYLHAEYPPPEKTTVVGWETPDGQRRAFQKLSWRWRAITLPRGGNVCKKGRGDAAASIYVTWKRGIKWQTLKYVWSDGVPPGTVCDEHNAFVREQKTIVLQSGGPLDVWHEEKVDLDADYRRFFAGGNPKAEVPDLIGIGLMTDGDQTLSPSVADYADFALTMR